MHIYFQTHKKNQGYCYQQPPKDSTNQEDLLEQLEETQINLSVIIISPQHHHTMLILQTIFLYILSDNCILK